MEKKFDINFTEGEGIDKVDFKGHVVMKRLNFAEKNALDEESTEIKIFGNTPQVKVSTSKVKELGILKSVVRYDLFKTTYVEDKVTKALMPVTKEYSLDINGIRDLPTEVGGFLVEKFTELNTISEKKNVN